MNAASRKTARWNHQRRPRLARSNSSSRATGARGASADPQAWQALSAARLPAPQTGQGT